MMGWRLTREAEADIIDIAEIGLRMFGEAQARSYHNALFDLIALIATNPRMARERPELTPAVRVQPFRSHLSSIGSKTAKTSWSSASDMRMKTG